MAGGSKYLSVYVQYGSVDAFQASHPSKCVIDPWNNVICSYKAASADDNYQRQSTSSAAVAASNLSLLYHPPTTTNTNNDCFP